MEATTRVLAKWRAAYAPRRYGILLGVLTALFVGPPLLLGFGMSSEWFEALMLLMALAAILSLCYVRSQRLFALLFGIPTIVFSLGGLTLSGSVGPYLTFVGHICGVLFLFGAAMMIVRSLLHSRLLALDTIYGAVCGYVFLGLGWATLYSMVETVHPGAMEFGEVSQSSSEKQASRLDELTYYSFVTLTTVGYGDITPNSPATKTLAWVEAITGQFYLAVIVAGLVSMLTSKRAGQTAYTSGQSSSESG